MVCMSVLRKISLALFLCAVAVLLPSCKPAKNTTDINDIHIADIEHQTPDSAPSAAVSPAVSPKSDGMPSDLTSEMPNGTYIEDYIGKLIISEICPKNEAGILDSAGNFSDWIEITNISDSPIILENISLTDDKSQKNKFVLPENTLAAGESKVLFASGILNSENELHAPFKLPAEGGSLYLYAGGQVLLDRVEYENARAGHSFYKNAYEEEMRETFYITPGYPNTDAGYEAFCASKQAASPLAISELQVSNDSLLKQSDGKYYDWVEIVNTSDKSVRLSDYYLTDTLGKRKYTLPDKTLRAGAYFVVICSGTEKIDKSGYYHAGFALNAESESLYLCETKGDNLIDWVHVEMVPYRGSYGRKTGSAGGFYYFTDPTPGKKNGRGFRKVCREAESTVPEGIYDKNIDVEFLADGTIYYTLDGSEPTTKSARYTGAISLNKTTVIRTVVYKNGAVNSRIKTFSYMIHENASLPVLSLVTESDNLWSDETGIYVEGNYVNYYQDWERFASLSYFDKEGNTFNINCGLKMHGGGSRESDKKKSFRVIFKGKYGQSTLEYDIFGNGVTSFDSLVLRAGEDYRSAIIRNDLLTTFSEKYFPSLLTQSGKYCLLYINGEFFGIYYFEERFNEKYFAEHFGVSEESVSMAESEPDYDSDLYAVMHFAENHDLTLPANYKYVTDRVDIESMTDWFILQAYSGNTDFSGNVRYFKSDEITPANNGKWKWAFYDLDWTFYFRKDPFENLLHEDVGETNMIIRSMLRNSEYRAYFLERLSYHINNTLKDENILEILDSYASQLRPEIKRERSVWGGSEAGWEQSIAELRAYISDYDRGAELIESITNALGNM